MQSVMIGCIADISASYPTHSQTLSVHIGPYVCYPQGNAAICTVNHKCNSPFQVFRCEIDTTRFSLGNVDS